MPTYNAVGVTATLSVAPLEGTLRADSNGGFAEGTALKERPIGADGSERGVQQFIGDYEDLPLFMVEVGERPAGGTKSSNAPAANTSSLSTTPAPSSPQPDIAQDRRDSAIGGYQFRNDPKPFQPFQDVAQPQTLPSQESTSQALMLTVETGYKTHLRKTGPKTSMQSLKMEIFFNGHMVGDALNNPRRGNVQEGKSNFARWSGTRVTSYIEKPWIYQAGANRTTPSHTAQDRWSSINESLQKEARMRGVDKKGMRPPTAEYFQALSAIALPERLRDHNNLGTIDVVITVGQGQKRGPEHKYLTGPCPMRSPRFTLSNTTKDEEGATAAATIENVDSSAEAVSAAESLDPPASADRPVAKRARTIQDGASKQDDSLPPSEDATQTPRAAQPSLPVAAASQPDKTPTANTAPTPDPVTTRVQPQPTSAVRSIAQTSARSTVDAKLTATEEKVKPFAKELGIDLVPGMMIPSYTNNRGKLLTNRKLAVRLSDIQRMNNGREKDRAIQEVKDQFLPNEPEESPTRKPARRPSRRATGKPKGTTLQSKQVDKAPDVFTSPKPKATPRRRKWADTNGVRPSNFAIPDEPASQTASVASTPAASSPATTRQSAVTFGLPSNSRLAQRITSISPTPRLDAGASSLTISPITTDANIGGTSKQKAPRKAAAKPLDIASISLPGNYPDCVLAYADGSIQRPARPTRPGDFDEEELVVGMRFVVI